MSSRAARSAEIRCRGDRLVTNPGVGAGRLAQGQWAFGTAGGRSCTLRHSAGENYEPTAHPPVAYF